MELKLINQYGVLVVLVLGSLAVLPAISAPLQNPWNHHRYWNSYEDLSMEDYGLLGTRPSSGYNAQNIHRPSTSPRHWLNSVEDNSWEYGLYGTGSDGGYRIGYGYDTSYEDYLEYQYLKQLLGAGVSPATRGSSGPPSKAPRNGRIPTIH